MNNSEAAAILEKVAQIWEQGLANEIPNYYTKDIEGYYYGYDVTYDDILERVTYLNEHQTERKLTFKDIIAEGNRVAARMRWQSKSDDGTIFDDDLLVIYHFTDDKKISKIWAASNTKIDYLAR
jgi:hypothetical protein